MGIELSPAAQTFLLEYIRGGYRIESCSTNISRSISSISSRKTSIFMLELKTQKYKNGANPLSMLYRKVPTPFNHTQKGANALSMLHRKVPTPFNHTQKGANALSMLHRKVPTPFQCYTERCQPPSNHIQKGA